MYQPATQTYTTDAAGVGPFTQTQLIGFIQAGDTLSVMGVPPGTGVRLLNMPPPSGAARGSDPMANWISSSACLALALGGGLWAQTISFNAPRAFPAGNLPSWAAAGDFNKDGNSDLAVADSGSAGVSILLGNGDGTYQNPVNYPAGNSPRYVAVRDFNRDGKLDLAVVNYNDSTVSILLGNGDGTFQAPVNPYAVSTNPVSSGGRRLQRR